MTKAILFVGVPHRGTRFAQPAACVSCISYFRGSSSDLLQLMAVGSKDLQALESEFLDSFVVQHSPNQTQPYIADVLELRPERLGPLSLGPV